MKAELYKSCMSYNLGTSEIIHVITLTFKSSSLTRKGHTSYTIFYLYLTLYLDIWSVTCVFWHFPSCEGQSLGVSCGTHTSALSLDELSFPMDPLPVVSPLSSGLRSAPKGATSHLMEDIYKSSTLLQHQSDSQPFLTPSNHECLWLSYQVSR